MGQLDIQMSCSTAIRGMNLCLRYSLFLPFYVSSLISFIWKANEITQFTEINIMIRK